MKFNRTKIYHLDTRCRIVKIYYQIQYDHTFDNKGWRSYYDESDACITDYDKAVSFLNKLRKEYQESDSNYMRSHVFSLVKFVTTEEALDV